MHPELVVFAGGYKTGPGATNVMDFVEFASTGNATDFGDLLLQLETILATVSNSNSWCFWMGGIPSGSPPTRNVILIYVTMASTGNATDFGDVSDREISQSWMVYQVLQEDNWWWCTFK